MVINNSIAKRNNYLTLDKGIKHELEKGMGVVTSNGVVGIIKEVSEHLALCFQYCMENLKQV